MKIKITNCTVPNGHKVRKNQNVTLYVSDTFFDNVTPEEFLDNIRYREHDLRKAVGKDFIVTNSSKVQII